MRISDGEENKIVLVADTEDERDALLLALRLRVVPWHILRLRMKDEMATARTPPASASSFSLANAARHFVAGAKGESVIEKEARVAGVARSVWEKAGTVAETSIWSATFAQAIAGVAKTAEEIESLAKPLGALTVVGCAFSLVAVSVRVVIA